MKDELLSILNKVVPNAYFEVEDYHIPLGGGTAIRVFLAASSHEINQVKRQHPSLVSLLIHPEKLTIAPQVFCGMGGQNVYLIPDKNNPKERFLALASVRIPFRKPKNDKESVLRCFEKFVKNWKETLSANLERLPVYPETDYSKAIS